jgi:hypothetical protein
MMPLKYLKDLDCWNLLSMVAMPRFSDFWGSGCECYVF